MSIWEGFDGAMRLTEKQRDIIGEAGLHHFGVVPWLFGSRLGETARGGDIDLFIAGNWPVEDAVRKRLQFCAELHRHLGDQEIDVVMESNPPTPVQISAKAQADPL